MRPANRAIVRSNPLDDPSWDSVLTRFPAATFFHTAAWARVLQETYGFRPLYLVHKTGDQCDGVLPLMEIDSWLTGRRGVSLPFTDHCEPLSLSGQTSEALAEETTTLARERRWRHWELRGGTQTLGLPVTVAFHGHLLDLSPGPEKLFARCADAVRRAVRKAERSEIALSFTHSRENMEAFHRLLCRTRQRHGVPPQPWHFFENIRRHVLEAGHGRLVLAWSEGRPIAGAVFFHFGRTVVFKFGASLEQFQHLRANNLVFWRAIEWHAAAGFETLDLGRTSIANEGLRRFKLGWGPVERRIEYARFDCRASVFAPTPDRAHGWQNRLFRWVPPTLARLIGAVAYKHAA